jgi:hypothetical protein
MTVEVASITLGVVAADEVTLEAWPKELSKMQSSGGRAMYEAAELTELL